MLYSKSRGCYVIVENRKECIINASFVFSFKRSNKVYLILKSDAILFKSEPAELQSTVPTSQNTLWLLKTSPKFYKHFCLKVYVTMMKVNKYQSFLTVPDLLDDLICTRNAISVILLLQIMRDGIQYNTTCYLLGVSSLFLHVDNVTTSLRPGFQVYLSKPCVPSLPL